MDIDQDRNLFQTLDQGQTPREQMLVRMVRDLLHTNRELRRQVAADPLTRVVNRPHFDAVLAKEWRRSSRQSAPLSLIRVDVDLFAHLNEDSGRSYGDFCLKRIADALAAGLHRAGDLLARFHEDEFAILLSWTGLGGASELAERLRRRVEHLRIPRSQGTAIETVTVSLGVACLVPGRESQEEALVQQAGQALTRAKSLGRNRVVCHSVDPAARAATFMVEEYAV